MEEYERYNVFQAIFMSFYSRKLYRDVAANWGGKAFLYLLLLLALSWILLTYQLQVGLNHFFEKDTDQIINQIPIVVLKDGKISTPEKHPYFIKAPNSNVNLAVIDTTGQYTTLEKANAHVLITETEAISQPKTDETRIYKFPTKLNLTIDPQVIKSNIQEYIGFAWIFIFLISLISSYIYRIIQALIYAIIGKILAAIFLVRLSYWQIVQIAMVAITPVVILATIFDFFVIIFPHQLLFYFILAMIYLIYGLIANKD